MDWAGQVIEGITGTTLGEAMRIRVLDPLSMNDSTFRPTTSMQERQATMHQRTDGQLAATDFMLPDPEVEMGGHGLFSTVDDYLNGDESFAEKVVNGAVEKFGKIDILVNNAAQQLEKESILEISAAQLDRTFRTNIFGMFYFVKAAFNHLSEGARIINSASITAYRGSPNLLDYASTKGAIVAFTRSLALNKEFTDRKIRVNAVAPGPIWTPLIPATVERTKEEHGSGQPLGRAGESYECAPAYVYLASDDSSYVTGQTIHVNGGEVVNG